MKNICTIYDLKDQSILDRLVLHLVMFQREGTLAYVKNPVDADIVLFLVSPASVVDQYKLNLTSIARAQGKRVIPILVGKVASLPSPIADVFPLPHTGTFLKTASGAKREQLLVEIARALHAILVL